MSVTDDRRAARARARRPFSDAVYGELEHDPTDRLPTACDLDERAVSLERNLEIVHRNLARLDAFIAAHGETLSSVRPTAAPIGFPRLTGVGDVDALCAQLAARGVLLLPGSVYDRQAHVRVGFGRADLPEALVMLEQGLADAAAAEVGPGRYPFVP